MQLKVTQSVHSEWVSVQNWLFLINQNKILSIIFWFRLVQNQWENGKYIFISVEYES